MKQKCVEISYAVKQKTAFKKRKNKISENEILSCHIKDARDAKIFTPVDVFYYLLFNL